VLYGLDLGRKAGFQVDSRGYQLGGVVGGVGVHAEPLGGIGVASFGVFCDQIHCHLAGDTYVGQFGVAEYLTGCQSEVFGDGINDFFCQKFDHFNEKAELFCSAFVFQIWLLVFCFAALLAA